MRRTVYARPDNELAMGLAAAPHSSADCFPAHLCFCSNLSNSSSGGTSIKSQPGSSCVGDAASCQGMLLPELEQLAWLEELVVAHTGLRLLGGVPAQWVQPGAFPHLKW